MFRCFVFCYLSVRWLMCRIEIGVVIGCLCVSFVGENILVV